MTDDYRPTYVDEDGRYWVRGEQTTRGAYEDACREDQLEAGRLLGKLERREPMTDDELRQVLPRSHRSHPDNLANSTSP